MKKITTKLSNLFELFSIQENEMPYDVTNEEILIETPNGDYTKINFLVKKEANTISLEIEDITVPFICAENHLINTPNGIDFAKNITEVLLSDGSIKKVISIKQLNYTDVFDVSIDYPHLYKTPNNLIHHNTHVSVVKAAKLLDEKKIKQIILCRPAVEAGEKLGFLPGTLDEKFLPWLKPIIIILVKCFGKGYTDYLFKSGKIVAEQLGYMRGATFEDAFVILDEAQNCTPSQAYMFLSRIGENCKMIIDGDTNQTDIKGQNGLTDAIYRLKDLPNIGHMKFNEDDCVRSEMCKQIIHAYRK